MTVPLALDLNGVTDGSVMLPLGQASCGGYGGRFGVQCDDEESIMTKGPDGVVRKLKDRVRALCKERRIRLQEFFTPFDVHHTKKISNVNFRRALDQAGLMAPERGAPPSDLLSLKEAEMLCKRYEVKGRGKGDAVEVNYWKMCEQIEKVFARRGLEKTPTLDVKLSLHDRPASRYGTRCPELSEDEVDAVAGLLAQIRLLSTTEGLVVKALFETFDKRHTGKVTPAIFVRQLDSMFKGKLSKVEARLLVKAYHTRDGAVSYRAMQADCDDATVAQAPPAAVPPASPNDHRGQYQRPHHQRQQKQHIQDLESRVEEPCPSMSPACPSQSPGRSTEEKEDDDSSSIFSSVTGFPGRGAVGFSVGEGGPFEGGDGLLDGVSGCGPGRSEARRASGGRARVLAGSGDSMQIERQMASKVAYHRLEPEDAYTPYDPNRSGTVTAAVFRRGLSDAFRMPFSEAQLDALAERYRCGNNQVSFRRLCDHVCNIADSGTFGRLRQAPGITAEEETGEREDASEKKIIDKTLAERQLLFGKREGLITMLSCIQEQDRGEFFET